MFIPSPSILHTYSNVVFSLGNTGGTFLCTVLSLVWNFAFIPSIVETRWALSLSFKLGNRKNLKALCLERNSAQGCCVLPRNKSKAPLRYLGGAKFTNNISKFEILSLELFHANCAKLVDSITCCDCENS